MNVYQRRIDKGDQTYWARWTGPDPENPGQTKRFLRSTDTKNKAEAEKIMRGLAAASAEQRWEVLDVTKQRKDRVVTIGEVLEHYPTAAAGHRLAPRTIRNNQHSLFRILRVTNPDEKKPGELPLSTLTGDLVYQYQQAVLAQAGDNELTAGRLCRSANSNLRQARSLFAGHMLTYYRRIAKLELPDIRSFMEEPFFRRVEKRDYDKPDDLTLERTFQALPPLAETDRNLFVAVWLAIGFGLRKSEITEAKRSWLIFREGVPYIRGDVLAKNGQTPDVRGQFDLWGKLAPLIADLPAESHLLTGTLTERKEDVFRRASTLMRGLGWRTQKAMHEWRAWAGCKVAEQEGLLAAQHWLRHESYSTTEKFYGRYVQIQHQNVALPSIALAKSA